MFVSVKPSTIAIFGDFVKKSSRELFLPYFYLLGSQWYANLLVLIDNLHILQSMNVQM